MLDSEWPLSFQLLLTRGWSSKVQERPKMAFVESMLRQEIIRLSDGKEEDNWLLDSRQRRSTYFFEKPNEMKTQFETNKNGSLIRAQ